MAEAMSNGWYYLPGGAGAEQQVGPLTWEQLYSTRLSGSLQPTDMVWHPALPQWTPASQIQGLFPAAAPPPAAEPAAAQPAPYQQPAYQQPAYQQQAYQQPAQAAPGAYPAPAGKRSKLWYWLGPLIGLILVGIALGVYFGFFYNKDGGGDPLPDDYYGYWNGTITYESLDLDEPTDATEDLRDQILDEEIPMTLYIKGLGDNNSAVMTIEMSAIDPSLDDLEDTMSVGYSESDDKLTLKSESSGDKATATVSGSGGDLEMEGDLVFKDSRASGEAVWTVSK